jgi:acetyltransferase EpsM
LNIGIILLIKTDNIIKDIIILGAGENGAMAVDIIEDINAEKPTFNVIGFLDDDKKKIGTEMAGFPVMGKMDTWGQYKNAGFTSPLVTTPKKNHLKISIVNKLNIPKENYINIISPAINLSRLTSIGTGNMILNGAQLQSNVQIGSHVYISNNSVICSNSIIDDYTNISNSVSIMGGVHINEGAYIGANCSIIGYISVGKWSIIGMGSVVLKPVKDYEIVAGNPARVIGRNTAAEDYFKK